MKVIFPVKVYQRFQGYIDSVPTEISGYGRITFRDGIFRVEEVKIFKQVCTPGSTIIDKNDRREGSIGKFWDELEDPSGWKLWWHSHADMKAYFSTTDDNTIDEADMQTTEDNWQLSIVGNKRGEMRCRLDVYAPFRYTIDDIPWDVDFSTSELEDEIFDEVSRKVQIYYERGTRREKKERVNNWERDSVGDEQLMLPQNTSTGSQQTQTPTIFRGGYDVDPEDLRKFPELFNRGKKN